jgi:large subunit ribosomal protein L23
MKHANDLIQTVILTEKATLLADEQNRYVFRVRPSATKPQIKKAIESMFRKKVVSVNTANYGGKWRRRRTAAQGRTGDWKKAIVTLAEGERIELA